MSNETPPAGQNEALFDLAQSWLRSGHKVAIAIVKRTWGSAPRQRGAIMVIRDDGLFEGSVSGGCVEGEVIAAAQDMLSIAIDEHQARPR
ncbi:MAG: XdhC family protein, partial [Pseudomonadota bacterium]